MAQANRAIGIARAAFYPNVVFEAGGGFEDHAFNLVKLATSFWSYGSSVSLSLFDIFQYRRLDKPPPAGGIDVPAGNNGSNNNPTKSAVP